MDMIRKAENTRMMTWFRRRVRCSMDIRGFFWGWLEGIRLHSVHDSSCILPETNPCCGLDEGILSLLIHAHVAVDGLLVELHVPGAAIVYQVGAQIELA